MKKATLKSRISNIIINNKYFCLFGVVSACELHPGWRHHLKCCTNMVAFKSLRSYWLDKPKKPGCQDTQEPNTPSLAVTPTDNLPSPKRGRNEEGEVTVKT